jgi:hypothetical protein
MIYKFPVALPTSGRLRIPGWLPQGGRIYLMRF